ncbi:MAG TPA: hypothetical protein VMV66_01730 [Candidatus Humimicrobiaceae bacterium]|nr:hypothetical protein [Candidatus Humimicrobiaceae bacterium]
MKKKEFSSAVKNVFDACRRLSKRSGEMRLFTPDGRMVGDIGEAIAGIFYQVNLHDVGRHDWDGTYNGRNVQIKATGGNSTYLKKPPKEGYTNGLLMVFYINRENGEYDLVYNGDIQRVWNDLRNKKLDKTDAKSISLDRLRELKKSVRPKDIVPGVLK